MRAPLPLLLFFALCGAFAGWLVGGATPAGARDVELHEQPWRLGRKVDDPLEVAPGRWTLLPYLFGDFDLQMDVELAADTHLDLLVRQVEPRFVDKVCEPFAGRWSTLRLSTDGDGQAWRARDEALAQIERPGVGLAPGLLATVWVRARGAIVTANVAGKDVGAHACVDRYGMAALVARGGNAVVRRLEILPVPGASTWWWARGTWAVFGGLGALALALVARARGASASWYVTSAVPVVLLAWQVARRADLELGFPPRSALALALVGCLLAALALLARRVSVASVLIVVAAGLALTEGAGRMGQRHDGVEALFGVDAGNQISEAYAQLVRGPKGLLGVDGKGPRVFLLGGQLLYDRGAPTEHLELLLARDLTARLQKPILTPCMPTVDGWTGQQWRLFQRCFTGHRPQVVVLGVPRDEMARDPATGVARSTPADVQRVIADAKGWCEQNGSRLLVFADANLPAELLDAVKAAARDDVVMARDGASPADLARQLAERLAPWLQP